MSEHTHSVIMVAVLGKRPEACAKGEGKGYAIGLDCPLREAGTSGAATHVAMHTYMTADEVAKGILSEMVSVHDITIGESAAREHLLEVLATHVPPLEEIEDNVSTRKTPGQKIRSRRR